MLAFSIDYCGLDLRVIQSVELFSTYISWIKLNIMHYLIEHSRFKI